MEVIIGILAVLAAAILLVLSMPIDLGIDLETAAANKIQFRLGWLFGLLNVSLSGRNPRPKKSTREPVKRHGRSLSLQRVKRALLTKGLPAAVVQFLRRVLRAVKVRTFRLRVTFGFDDPADTGMLLAVGAPVLWLLREWSGDHFHAEADFNQEIARADGKVDVRVYPLRILAAFTIFLLSPASLRAAKAMLWS